MERRRYVLHLAYEGTPFRGFQRQPTLPTIQEAIEEALAELGVSGHLDVAARTDSGVHALAQVVSFWARKELDPEELRATVNRRTPPGIVCSEAHRAPRSFHARASAISRRYVYLVGLPPPPAWKRFAWTLPDERAFPGMKAERLDGEAMRRALARMVGRHDFSGFARPGAWRDPVRTILSAELREASWGPLYALVLEGEGFLRAMVRNLVGTAVAVGLGLIPPERVSEMLSVRERYRGVRAPAWGLSLVAVTYPEGIRRD